MDTIYGQGDKMLMRYPIVQQATGIIKNYYYVIRIWDHAKVELVELSNVVRGSRIYFPRDF